VVVGIGKYWYDRARHRPPYKDYDGVFYGAAYWEFEQNLFGGQRDRVYESTSLQEKYEPTWSKVLGHWTNKKAPSRSGKEP
jgi:hypothetical protein